MKIPGLEVPEMAEFLLRPDQQRWGRFRAREHIEDRQGARRADLFVAAPELAQALVRVTEALVAAFEVHVPDITPANHAAVRLALGALAKARGEA